MFRLFVEHDQDAENPSDDGDGRWQFYSFNRNHVRFKDPDEFLPHQLKVLKRKLKVGLAFFLSYYEHGLCMWSLSGEGPSCQWDTVSRAGILVWEEDAKNLGPKTYEDRAQDARGFLEEYTEWCNGQCFYFRLEDHNGENLDSCGSIYGSESLARIINETLSQYPNEKIILDGDSTESLSYHTLNLPIITEDDWEQEWEEMQTTFNEGAGI